MNKLMNYRNLYVVVGVVFALVITQSNLAQNTQMWILVAYIVGGIVVAELLTKKARKKKENVHS
ncbi:hypothetical protein [Planococcus notacanthi]|uniref:Uncharacterized protein n=1 Tax=Planococcus notacanthi TaxID=3035188 RepID=A0ABT7ZPR5_9BACL|nr:hypothetical protein [Planococcus sp. APC 4016]MDN3429179.1 hypothetical protein [Planococcus sp. APC 4016]QJS06180.1 hypothetical protein [Planococcus sp. (in: firmicutes)]